MTSDWLHQFTHIGRNLDPRHPYHRYLLLVALLAGVGHTAWALFTGGHLLAALGAGFGAGLSVAIAWILTRELDPDHQVTALVSGAVAGLFVLGLPRLLPLLALVMLLRVANRTVGLPLRWGDTVGVLLVVAGAAFAGWWPVALLAVVAFGLDAVMAEPLPRHRWAAVACAILTIMVLGAPAPEGLRQAGLVPLAGLVGFSWYTLQLKSVHTTADNGGPLYLERVQAGMIIAVVGGVLFLLMEGNPAVAGFAPLWAAMLGPVIGWAWRTVIVSEAEEG